MPKVTTIPPRKQRNHAVTSQETRRIRVAAYCRVSTDTEEQATSYQAQIAHYEESFIEIRNGSLLGSMPMTASVQPLQNIGNSFIR